MKTKINKNINEEEFFKQFSDSIKAETKNYVRLSMDIASQINALLEKENLSQRELASRLGKKESEISKWLSGNHNFTIKSLAKIETVLDEQFIFTREEIAYRFLPFLLRQFRDLYTSEHYNRIMNFYCMSEKADNKISFILPLTTDNEKELEKTGIEESEATLDQTRTIILNDEIATNTAA